MEDIATALGKKKSFLYYYFESKSDVIAGMLRDELAMLNRTVRDAAGKGRTPAEQIRNYLEVRIECLTKRIASYANARFVELFSGSGADVKNLLKMRQEFDRDEERFLSSLLEQGMKDGSFRTIPATVVDDTTYFLLSATRGLELELVLEHEIPSDAARRMIPLVDIFLRGLAP